MEDFSKILKEKIKIKEDIVKGLLPQGVTNFSGESKVGKTYFLLQMCLAIVTNNKFLDRETSNIAKILYYSNETNKPEMQRRGKLIIEKIKSNKFKMDFKKAVYINDIEKEILKVKRNKNDIILVIIDTSEKTNYDSKLNLLKLQDAYKSMDKFFELEEEYNASFILVRHNVKTNVTDNEFNAISGSVGITASAETNIIITRTDLNEFKLMVESRYLPPLEINLSKTKDGFFQLNNKEVLIETDDRDLVELIKFITKLENKSIEDTATNICTKANLKYTTPNVLYKKLCKNKTLLSQCHVEFGIRKSNGKHLIKIEIDENEEEDDDVNEC